MSNSSMEGETTESGKGPPSKGTRSVLIIVPISATSTLKVCWELLADIVLQKMYPNSCQKITPIKLDFISSKKIQHYNSSKLDAKNITHVKIEILQHK
jgi:hypothetical protein